MKKQPYLLLISIICLSFLLLKCGKDGAVGPQGNTGDKGANGLVGPAGPAGTDGKAGSVIYSGNTVPAASKGVTGDFYLNTATGLLYGPKAADGWGAGLSLKGANGAAGATGAAGSTTLSGAGAPALSLGKTGDYYLDKTNYLLYGPKTASGWGVPVNLRGPAGPQGPPGTANVIYSDWEYAVYFRDTVLDNSVLHIADLAAPKLTQAILDKGTTIVYFTFGTAGPFPLPYTSNAGGKYNTLSYLPRVGRFIITRVAVGNATDISLSTSLQYRYVIIPGGITAAAAKQININNYESVRKYYGIVN